MISRHADHTQTNQGDKHKQTGVAQNRAPVIQQVLDSGDHQQPPGQDGAQQIARLVSGSNVTHEIERQHRGDHRGQGKRRQRAVTAPQRARPQDRKNQSRRGDPPHPGARPGLPGSKMRDGLDDERRHLRGVGIAQLPRRQQAFMASDDPRRKEHHRCQHADSPGENEAAPVAMRQHIGNMPQQRQGRIVKGIYGERGAQGIGEPPQPGSGNTGRALAQPQQYPGGQSKPKHRNNVLAAEILPYPHQRLRQGGQGRQHQAPAGTAGDAADPPGHRDQRYPQKRAWQPHDKLAHATDHHGGMQHEIVQW